MPPQALAPDTLPADFFSKAPPDTLPANFDFGERPTAQKSDSLLGHAWKWMNQGLISKDTLVRAISGMPSEELDKQLSPYAGESPTHAGIREFIRGAIQDTGQTASSFTSPLAVASAGLGAAGKAPGAIGTIAKVASGAAGAGFGAQGAKEVYGAGLGVTPEQWQQRLQGGAMMAAGGAAAAHGVKAVAPAASRALLLGRTPQEAYQSALKPSTTLSDAERARIVQTGLEEKIPVNKGGLEAVADRIADFNQRIKDVIAADPNRAVTNKFAIASRLGSTTNRFATQVAPTADLQSIADVGNDFLNTAPDQISASQAQAMKQGTYRALGDKAYGELKGASIEAQKALARGLKDELANTFPELAKLNASESKLLDLQPVLEKAINRIGNHQLAGIGTPITAGAVKAVTGSSKLAAAAGFLKAVLDDPSVKSRLAISLSKAGVPPNSALARVQSYQASLGYLGGGLQSASSADNAATPASQTP